MSNSINFIFKSIFITFFLGINASFSQFITHNGTTINADGGSPACDGNAYYDLQNASATGNCGEFTDGTFQKGAFWVCDPLLNLNQSFKLTFDAYFGNDPTGGDGIVFVLQTESTAAIGGAGGGIAYGEGNGSGCGAFPCPIDPSVAIEFDTWNNTGGHEASSELGTNCDHAAIYTNGILEASNNLSPPTCLSSTDTSIVDDASHIVCIIWDPAIPQYSAYFDGDLVANYNGDIRTVFSDPTAVIWGWVSASGGASQRQEICNAQMVTNIASPSCCSAPVATATPSAQTICSNQSTSISLSSSQPGTTYDWIATDNLNVTGESTTMQSGSSIVETLVNTSTSNQIVTYTITPTAAGCTGNPIIVNITVEPTPTITNATTIFSICSGQTTNIIPTADIVGSTFSWTASGSGNVSGFSASGNGSISEQLNLDDPFSSSETVTYVITPTAGSCSGNAVNFVVTINPLPNVSITDPGDFCSNDPVQAGLNGGTPLGGTYSGPGVTDNANDTYDFSPSGAGVGVHDIVYSFTDGNSCTSSDTVQVEVFLAPVLTFTALADLCINEDEQTGLGGATPTGGVYSGTGVTDDGNGLTYSFDPSVAGVGVHDITYSYTDGNSCSNTIIDQVEVFGLPVLTFTALNDLCVGAGVQAGQGGATPVGGEFFGPGVTDNGNGSTYSFDPNAAGVGIHTISYTYTDGNSCTDTITDQVEVFAAPVVALTDPGDFCSNDPVQAGLNGGTPLGGTYSGPGVTDNANDTYDFSPSGAGVGVHDIVYSFTDGNSCTSSDTVQVEVFLAPVLTFTALADLCINEDEQTGLGGATPTGGVYSGTGVTDDGNGLTYSFDPSVAGVGVHSITYSYTDGNSCSNTIIDQVEVFGLPVLTFTALNDLCVGAGVQAGQGGATPVGGEFFGPGVTDNGNGSTYSFDPNAAGVGIHTISYTYTDGNSCTDTITDQVEVFATPVVDLTDPSDFCSNDPVQAGLNGGTPLGGTYSGPGVTDNANDTYDFSPSGAGVGVHDIVYSFIDGNSCSSSDTVQVEVFLAPVLTFPVLNDVCIDAGNQILGGATPGGGVYSGTGVTDDGNGTSFTFDPNIAGVGTHTITYNYTDGNSCSDFTTQTITVDDTPTINGTLEACIGQTQNLVGSGTPNATNPWISSNGAIAGVDVNGQVSAVADGSVTITYTDINGCTADSIFTVNPTPVITLDTLSPSVCDGLDGQITVNGAGTGTVTWSGAAAGNDSPVALPYVITGLGAGNYNVFFTDDATTCSSASVAAILLNPGAPEIFPIDDTASCEIDFIVPDPVTFTSGNNLTAGIAFYSASGGNAGDLIPQGTPITSAMSPMTIFVYDNNGTCDAEVSFIVNVNTNPTAAISPDPAEACEGNAINLNGNPAGGSGTYTSHTWTGDVAILNATNIVNPIVSALTTPNTYNLTYQVIDNNGCTITDDIQVVINDVPDLSGTLDVCVGLTTTILSTGTPDAVTPWTSSNPAVATVDNAGVVTGVTAGSTDITFLDDNGCSNTVTVTVNALPVISLTPTQPTGCNLTNGSLLIQLVSGLGSGSIALGGDSVNTFNPITLPYTISNLGAGTYDVILTDNNSCVSNNPSETLINPNAPIINPISDTISCAINFVVPDAATWVTGADLTGNQEFYDTPGGNIADLVAATTVITAAMSPMTLYAYDANGSCNTEESFVITINALPTINIAGNNPICDGEDITLTENGGSANSWNWSSLNGSATFDDNTTDLTTISGAVNNEEFQVVVTDANNCSDSASVVVTVNTLPVISLTPTQPTGCNLTNGSLLIQLVSGLGSGSIALGGDSVNTFNPITLPYTISNLGAGTYDVILTDNNSCVSNNPSETLINPNAPIINPISDTISCAINFVVPDAATWVTGADLTGNQEFYDTPGGNIADLVAATTVITAAMSPMTLYAYDANGSCNTEESFVITINALPTINIAGNNPICDGEDITLTENGGSANSWNWSSLNGSATFDDNTTDLTTISGAVNNEEFQVVVTDANNCSDSASVVVTVNTLPTVNISGNNPICDGEDITLTENGGSANSWNWSSLNGSATFDDNTTDLTTISGAVNNEEFQVVVTDVNNCSDSASVVVTVNALPTVNISGNNPICDGEDITLTEDGGSATSWNWSSLNGSATFNDNTTDVTTISDAVNNEEFQVVVTDANNCSDTASVIVTVNALPTVNISGNNPICDGQDITLTEDGGDATSWNWSSLNGSATFNDNTLAGTTISGVANFEQIQVVVTDVNNCSDSDYVFISVVNNPSIDPLDPITACDSYDLPPILGTNLSGNQAYYDDTQINGGNIIAGPITATSTIYMYDGANGCEDEQLVQITINNAPSVTGLPSDATYCDFENIADLNVDVSGIADWTIYYSIDGVNQSLTSSSAPINIGNNPGTYVIDSIADLNCTGISNESFTITVNPTPLAPTVSDDGEFCSTDQIPNITANGGSGTFNWYLDDNLSQLFGQGPEIAPINQNGITTYYVTETANNCEGLSSLVNITINDCELIIPTAFTPNYDGNNDTWEISPLDDAYPNNAVFIYNRWGALLFEHNSQTDGPYNNNQWDGTFNGEELPVGSYFFVIQLNDQIGQSINGAVSIIKEE